MPSQMRKPPEALIEWEFNLGALFLLKMPS